MPRCRVIAAASIVLVLARAPAAADDDRRLTNIRTTDRRLAALVQQGLRASPTLRALVRRLERSDVIVYLECDGPADTRIAGRLAFVSAAAGLRYLLVRVARLPAPQQIALLGHELQHAVEIADDASIVDDQTLARAYMRIGHVTSDSATGAVSFDTEGAVAAGRMVLGELERETNTRRSARVILNPEF